MTKKEAYQKILTLLVSRNQANQQLAFYTMNAIDKSYKVELLIDLVKYAGGNEKELFDFAKTGELPSDKFISDLSMNIKDDMVVLKIDKDGLSDVEVALGYGVKCIEFENYSSVCDLSSLKNVYTLRFNMMCFTGKIDTLPNQTIEIISIVSSYEEHIQSHILDYLENIPKPYSIYIRNATSIHLLECEENRETANLISPDILSALPRFNLRAIHFSDLIFKNTKFLKNLSKCENLKSVIIYECILNDFDLDDIGCWKDKEIIIQDCTVHCLGIDDFNHRVEKFKSKHGNGSIQISQVNIASS